MYFVQKGKNRVISSKDPLFHPECDFFNAKLKCIFENLYQMMSNIGSQCDQKVSA